MEKLSSYPAEMQSQSWNQLLVLRLALYIVSAAIFGLIFFGYPTSSHSSDSYTYSIPDITENYVEHIVSSITKNKSESKALAKHIVDEARAGGYDPLFIASVVKAESTFNPMARSNRGALGLMQILPDTGKYISGKISQVNWNGIQALTKPGYNLKLGIGYLKYLEKYFGNNREHVLIAYNWGPANLKRALKANGSIAKGPKAYADKILSTYKLWKEKTYIDANHERLA
ncbi:MAG: lytic transglycosylase domain-containing protein [Bdellovibrionota bacterium]